MQLTHQQIVSLFCSDHESRYAMKEPFLIGEYEYASDGRICLRWKANGSASPDAKGPPADTVFVGFPDKAARRIPITMPTLAPLQSADVAQNCDECFGEGFVTCEYDHEHRCPECRGTGKGEGGPHYPGMPAVDLGEWGCNPDYLAAVCATGATELQITKPNKPGYFQSGIYEGLLMPISLKDNNGYLTQVMVRIRKMLAETAPASA